MNGGAMTIPALDGYALPATLFLPPGEPSAAVIMSPATATPRRFYRAFCDHLAANGCAVVSYDYRGTFEPPHELRRSTARIRDWGELDFAGVVDWMTACYPQLPLYVVGHSVGGHALLMTDRSARVRAAFVVASQSAYWRLYDGIEQYRIFVFMQAIMPVLTRIFGYFPGERIAFGTNLAPQILYEWARWCRLPAYFFDDPGMRDVLACERYLRAPVTLAGLLDDPWATPRAIDALAEGFASASVTRIDIDPATHGLRGVGHMGFFRPANAALWHLVDRAFDLTDRPKELV